MSRFMHAVTPVAKTPEARTQDVLRELSKLSGYDMGRELPDIPYCEKLINKGLSATDPQALHAVAEYLLKSDQTPLVKKVLATPGFPVNRQNANTETLLHWAAMRGNAEIAGVLLDMNADKSIKNRHDVTAFDAADLRGTGDDGCKAVADLLRGHDDAPETPSRKTSTPPARGLRG